MITYETFVILNSFLLLTLACFVTGGEGGFDSYSLLKPFLGFLVTKHICDGKS